MFPPATMELAMGGLLAQTYAKSFQKQAHGVIQPAGAIFRPL